MKRSPLIAVLVGFMAVVASANDASAYYHAGMGRFVSRDPVGYGDGMSLYQYVRSNPVAQMDPLGLQTGPSSGPATTTCACICVTNPADCILEYSNKPPWPPGPWPLGIPPRDEALMLTAPGGRVITDQSFKTPYFVNLKTRSGASTEGCHIRQDAQSLSVFAKAGEAYVLSAKAAGLDPDHAAGYQSWLFGNTAVVSSNLDYIAKDTKVTKDNNGRTYVRIFDQPAVVRDHGVKLLTYYRFGAANWVEEAPAVKGWLFIDATMSLAPGAFSMEYNRISSDGNVNERAQKGKVF